MDYQLTEPCIIWRGRITKDGYGIASIKVGGRFTSTTAHRWAWQQANGPLPKHLVVDHLCRNRLCIELTHLEPVTQAENVSRGLSMVLRTRCRNGHEMTLENSYWNPSGQRRCRQCVRVWQQKQREALKVAA